MKKNSFLLTLILIVSLSSCDTVDFGDINTNPNAPSDAATASLLTNSQRSIAGYIGITDTNFYVQYLSSGQYDEASRYQTLNWGNSGWYGVLADLKDIVKRNTDEDTKVAAQAYGSNANQIAVATILRVYFFHGMTDRWGMLPYTESLRAVEELYYPVYDSQQSIYNGLLAELDAALAMIDNGNGVSGDILFGGDMSRWKEFGNTIKLVMGLRLAKADPSTGKAKFNQAMNSGISSNGNNIFYPYLSEDANDNPYQDHFVDNGRRDYLVSDVFVNALIGNGSSTAPEDPRLAKMSDPASNFPGEYIGAPYGETNSATDNYSFITSDIITKSDAPLMIYTYAEVLFARAEAAALGWTSESASTLFESAIMASMEQWGVDSTTAQTYIDNNPYTGLDDIGYEKWVALYLQGYNGWASWRSQTALGHGKPLTAPADLLSNATGIPQRHGYPSTARSLNESNYDAAIATQGEDGLNTVLWINK